MKAVIFDNGIKFLEDYPIPEPQENEALIRVSMAGICNTDLEILNPKNADEIVMRRRRSATGKA